VGGLGVFLVRRLMDDVSYRRENDQNIMKLTVDPRLQR
jgi:anti-sigma regulatory factor (Ser/Thr protein kinase)